MAANDKALSIVPLGKAGFKGSRMGLGCMGMSGVYKNADEDISDEEIARVFDRCVELGVTVLNTAEFYGADQHNWKLIGKNTAHRRESFLITTKFGARGDLKNGITLDSSREHVRDACAQACEVFGVSTIELFILARVDPKTPLADTMNYLKELVDEDKVKYIGLSEVTADEIREAHSICPLTCVEQEWSLWSRDIEQDIIPTCKELDIGVLAYSPLGRGFLTGTIDKAALERMEKTDFRVIGQPRMQGDHLEANLKLVEKVKDMAKEKNATPGQIAIAWLYHQAAALGVDMIAIPGTKKTKYLDQNVAALDVTLSDDDVKLLNSTFDMDAVSGDRYGDAKLMYKGRLNK